MSAARKAQAPAHVRGGRPSLSDDGGQSPIVHIRIPRQLAKAAADRAAAEGVSVSELGRIALERFLEAS